MEILTAADARFPVEDGELIDFGIDEGEAKDEEEEEEEDEYEHLTSFFKGDSGSSTSPMEYLIPAETTTEAAAFSGETVAGSFPEFMEEDLEWLSNKDAFPGVETCFGILSENPELIMKHHSPISVLEHNTTSTTTTTTTTTNSNTTINASNVTSCCDSFRVPTNHPVRPRTKRRRCKRVVFGDLSSWSNQVTLKNKQESSPLLFPLPSTKSGSTMGRRCLHCRTDKTPQWRAGPMGPKTLCNACGVRYKSGRLLPEYRPASSPTFSSALHSNSHRKVVEMRRQKQLPVATDLGVSTKF